MSKEQKTTLTRIILSAVLLAAVWLSPLSGIWKLAAFLVPYLLVGYDVLFSAVNVARHLKQDSEETLTRAADKFAARVKAAERLANESGNTLDGLTDEELDKLWRQAKVCTER